MFAEYLEKLLSTGKRYFSSQEITKDLDISQDAARSGLYRLKKDSKLISPLKGLYVIVPPEHKPYGSIPAQELIPIMMQYINAEYYVSLLSAAEFYGAAHQKPMLFQVTTNKRIKHSLTFGKITIQIIYKRDLTDYPTKDFTVSSGYLKVATPEVIAIDLLEFPKYAGGLNNIATVLSELIESINAGKLIQLAEKLDKQYQLQRLGYIIEKIDVMDETAKNSIIETLAQYVASHITSYIALTPVTSQIGYPRCRKWKIIENTGFESDL